MSANDVPSTAVRCDDPRVRSVEIDCGQGVRVSLAHYRPHSAQRRHRHDYGQVSFLLAGSLQEQLHGCEYQLRGAGVGYKPPEAWHSDVWGGAGALIFSLKLSPERAESLEEIRPAGWAVRAELSCVPDMVRACFATTPDSLRGEAVEDALAAACAPKQYLGSRPPAWLEVVREQIFEAPEMVAIEEAARAAGVHRVHLSRMFVRFYGAPPSVYRRRVMAARAVTAAARSRQSLTQIAHATGFSDHAHMTRTLQGVTGLGPSNLRALLSGARLHSFKRAGPSRM